MEAVIPFSYQVETSLVNNQDYVRIMPSIDQITASLNGSDEVEIKAVINMNISVFSKKCQDVITDIQILPVDLERKARMPGIVGYMVQEGDSIWSIAKNYYSSLDSIRSINKLTSDDISPGDKLIIVKSVSAG
jgi:LysM repeat protein